VVAAAICCGDTLTLARTVILRVAEAVFAGLDESVTVIVNAAALAEDVGVPQITPVDAFKARPLGKAPLTVHV
jgi:hypothetical protein